MGSVTDWLERLEKDDDNEAAELIWQRYVQRLARLARKKLGGLPRRAADEEDVVLSAFRQFLEGAKDGRFPRLHDRDDLWHVLVVLTERRAISQGRHERAAKRGGGQTRGESALERLENGSSQDDGFDNIAEVSPTPEFAVQLAEHCEHLLTLLPDALHRQIVLAKLEGLTNAEVAKRLDISLRSVERKLPIIRRRWEKELDS